MIFLCMNERISRKFKKKYFNITRGFLPTFDNNKAKYFCINRNIARHEKHFKVSKFYLKMTPEV